MKNEPNRLLFAVDIAGTLVFAVEGATAAMRGGLDLLGLMVLAFATALGGGIVRDVLIGDVPPASLKDWHYSAVAFAGGAVVFFLHQFVQGVPRGVVLVLDAAGWRCLPLLGPRRHWFSGCVRSSRFYWGRLRESAGAHCVTSCWHRCRAYCEPTSMRPRH